MTKYKLLNILQYVIFVMLAVIFFAVGPVVEKMLFPVITKFEIPREAIEHLPDGSARISGVLIKARGTCDPVEGSLIAFTDEFINSDERPAKAVRLIREPNTEWHSLPPGSQYFGPWVLVPPGRPLGPALIIRIRHRCHPFWETETTLYTGLTSDFFPMNELTDSAPWEKGEYHDGN